MTANVTIGGTYRSRMVAYQYSCRSTSPADKQINEEGVYGYPTVLLFSTRTICKLPSISLLHPPKKKKLKQAPFVCQYVYRCP